MRTITRTAKFKRDYRRLRHSRLKNRIDKALLDALDALVRDQQLLRKFYGHALKGQYKDCRDCHLLPDVVLVYRKTG